MKFTKMHGIGNDYVYVDCVTAPLESMTALPPARLAEYVSDRHFGIGSDGLILIKPSQTADFCMEMYNADGSQGAMCGNGIRCVAKYVYDHGLTNMTTLRIETKAGIKTVELTVAGGKVTAVKVSMGVPALTSCGWEIPLTGVRLEETGRLPVWEMLPLPDGGAAGADPSAGMNLPIGGAAWQPGTLPAIGISMGNPHTVLFYENLEKAPVLTLGPVVEKLPRFPDRTNVEFIAVKSHTQLEMRVWERGSGETLACGTGACASAVAAMLAGFTDRTVQVKLLGGSLKIYWNPETDEVEMSGPATEVFQGEIAI